MAGPFRHHGSSSDGLVRHFAPRMADQGGGKIVAVTSAAPLRGIPVPQPIVQLEALRMPLSKQQGLNTLIVTCKSMPLHRTMSATPCIILQNWLPPSGFRSISNAMYPEDESLKQRSKQHLLVF